jgi:hypothetical protein
MNEIDALAIERHARALRAAHMQRSFANLAGALRRAFARPARA